MNRRTFLKRTGQLAAAALLSPLAVKARAEKQKRPNVLIIATDDQGYADLSAYAHSAPDISTPNMDRLAKEGVLCTQAYVSAPVCSPSRAGWNTGRYQQRWNAAAGWNPGHPENVKNIAEYFKDAGYVTGKVGKNDYGKGYHAQDVREYPLNHGYDEFLGFSSHAHDFFALSEDIEKRTPDPHGASAALGSLFHNRSKKSYEEGYTTEIFTDAAIDFLKRHKTEPFFLTLYYNSVHHLIHEVPDRYLKKHGVKKIPNYDPDTMGRYRLYYNKYNKLDPITDSEMRKYYLANLDCLDENIGKVLDAMDDLDLTRDTLVIFLADNGGSPLTGACNRPLRGSKYVMYEGGIRVPFMTRFPGRLPRGKTYDYRISTLDILPTALQAAGIKAPPPNQCDGESFLEAIQNLKPSPTENRPLFWKFKNSWAVRDGDWKLVKTSNYTSRKATSRILHGPQAKNRPMLFNIKDDIAEQNDLYEKHPQIVKRLTELYQQWQKQNGTISTKGPTK
jgi:arylsulfatase A-like enzyme